MGQYLLQGQIFAKALCDLALFTCIYAVNVDSPRDGATGTHVSHLTIVDRFHCAILLHPLCRR